MLARSLVVEKLTAVFRARSGDKGVVWYWGKYQGSKRCIRRMTYNRNVPTRLKSKKQIAYSLPVISISGSTNVIR